jgi:nuclear pore complex protein Nup188
MAYLDQEVDLQEHEDPYLASPDVLGQIHKTVMDAANANLITASPVIFAWSLILYRMYVAYQERVERRDLAQNQQAQDHFELENQPSSTGRRNSVGSIVSMEKSPYDLFLANSSLERDMQTVERLAKAVTSRGLVYDLINEMALCLGTSQDAAIRPLVGTRARLVFLELLKTSFPVVGYLSEPVTALLSVLSGGQQYWDLTTEKTLLPDQELPAIALNDPELLELYLSQSLSRYPYEFIPFMSLCQILSSSLCKDDRSDALVNFLLKTPSLTLDFGDRWDNYELAQEVDNSNTIRLLQDEYLFATIPGWKRRLTGEEAFCIPAGTYGRFVTDGGKVVLLEHKHSTLALLGKRLEINTAPDGYREAPLGFLRPEETAAAIELLATLLRATFLKSSSSDEALNFLQEASKALPRTKDIISVVCDTLDGVIEGDLTDFEGSQVSVVSACVRFLHATLPLLPGRIWSYMARCELLNTESRAGRLSRITGSLDMVFERFELLSSSVKLFSSLTKNAMASVVQRKIGNISSGRHKSDDDSWLGTSDSTITRVSLSIAQASVDIYENSATWRFSSELQRSSLVRDVVEIMNDMITFSFSLGPDDSSTALTACLAPARKHVVDSFLSIATGSLKFQPLISSFLVGFQIPESSLYPQREEILVDRLVGALKFATTLLKVANYLDEQSTVLQTRFFRVASLVARLFAIRDSFKLPSLAFLQALIESAWKGNNEPPSLLGFLGPHISRSFIQMVSKLDKPLDRLPTVIGVWRFFTSIMRNRQQWMANCLLTGKTPREALQGDGKISKISEDSVLHIAAEKLNSISTLPSEESLAVLDFFTSAQNFWPWTVLALQQKSSFLSVLRNYVHNLKPPSVIAKSDAAEAAYQARIAAYIAETFAMQLYHLRQMGKQDAFAKEVTGDLDYFLRDGVQVSGYNQSLHANFAKNFANRYPGCCVEDFKTTLLEPRNLGVQYYYALDYADAMLGFDAGWLGPRRNGFRHEMETANLNLSLVDAQIVSRAAMLRYVILLMQSSRHCSMLGNISCWSLVFVSCPRTRRSQSRCCRWQRSVLIPTRLPKPLKTYSSGLPSRGRTSV